MDGRPKRGQSRPDGKLFMCHKTVRGQLKEIWVTPERLERVLRKQQEYRKKLYARHYKSTGAKLKIGEKHPEKDLYFLRISSVGKEVWGTAEELERARAQASERSKRYQRKKRMCGPPDAFVGMPHPEKPGLVAIKVERFHVRYGTEEQLVALRQKCIERGRIYREKNREALLAKVQRAKDAHFEVVSKHPELKRHRGDIDPVLGLVFWGYSSTYKERWVTKEKFEDLWARHKSYCSARHLQR